MQSIGIVVAVWSPHAQTPLKCPSCDVVVCLYLHTLLASTQCGLRLLQRLLTPIFEIQIGKARWQMESVGFRALPYSDELIVVAICHLYVV